MSEYKIPEEYYFRIHHVRPRFKGDIENVLIYMAEEITRVGEQPTDEFVKKVNEAIYRYPGNAHRELKTINNWRTEISALFGFVEHTDKTEKPGRRAIELASNEDLVECFNVFLYNFQYPGAHIKPKNVLEQIENGIHFKPAQYILKLLKFANREGGNSVGITKYEACHCIFNDLRVTRDNEGVEKTWERISENRKKKLEYDQTGDVVRYAGDILDYMEIANLLKTYDSYTYYLNTLEGQYLPIKHCLFGTWGFNLVPDVKDQLDKSDYVLLEKETFGSIELIKQIKNIIKNNVEISSIEFAGLCFDICVLSNAVMIKNSFPNIKVFINTSCTSATSKKAFDATKVLMKSLQIEEINE